MPIRIALLALTSCLAWATAGWAQPPKPCQSAPHSSLAAQSGSALDADASAAEDAAAQAEWVSEGRACEACPRRSVKRALLQTTFVVNLAYEVANLARGQVTARITPQTWWANMKQGWVWDLDDFVVNQVGHPYQGNNYFNAGRSNGLSFYESAAVTAFGSATWEFYGETNHASLNDFINTTLGGVALGEILHRAAWLVRNPQATGRDRLWSEIGATVLDPITGLNRFASGDASRVTGRPDDLVPSDLEAAVAAGVLWRGSQTRGAQFAGQPFVELDGLYGDLNQGRSRTPYDAFAVRLRMGGGSGISEARVRGRLLAQPMGRRGQFAVVQSYDFHSNDAYRYAAQSFDATFLLTQPLSSTTTMLLTGWGGVTALGAVDSLPVDLDKAPEKPPPSEDSPGQGVSEGPRYYDYGPGSDFGVGALFMRKNRSFATLSYEGRHIYSLDGVRARHFLQRVRVDLLAPLRGRLGLGATGEYLSRHTYYQDAASTVRQYHYPQLRAYLTWSVH